jgi:2-phospho-L-lactate transferase/gluconeogenesis factor (CofD/UPF0052 family)
MDAFETLGLLVIGGIVIGGAYVGYKVYKGVKAMTGPLSAAVQNTANVFGAAGRAVGGAGDAVKNIRLPGMGGFDDINALTGLLT